MVARHPLYAVTCVTKKERGHRRGTQKSTLIQPRNDFRDAQGKLAGE